MAGKVVAQSLFLHFSHLSHHLVVTVTITLVRLCGKAIVGCYDMDMRLISKKTHDNNMDFHS